MIRLICGQRNVHCAFVNMQTKAQTMRTDGCHCVHVHESERLVTPRLWKGIQVQAVHLPFL